ncbi:MAG: hypothetical protein ABW318_18920 [Vicinamibacterales bacterium]
MVRGRTSLLFAGPQGLQLYWQMLDGGAPELIAEDARAPEHWSAPAGVVTFITRKGEADFDIWAFSPSDRSLRPIVEVPTSAQMSSRLSPDTKWLAYEANDSGAFEVYVEPFPRTGARTRVTNGGSQRPVVERWPRDLFRPREHALCCACADRGAGEVGMPARLPVTKFLQGFGRRLWEVTPDGKRFMVMFL